MTGRLFSLAVTHRTAGARTLLDANCPESGLVVAQVPPAMRRTTEMCTELLAAFGKRDDVSGPGRRAERNWTQLLAWMAAYRIANLVLVDAQWLPAPILDEVAGLAALSGADIWLVAQQPIEDDYPKALSRWPVMTAPARQLAEIIKARPSEAAAPPVSFPRVPSDSFLSFRAEARRRLPADEFAAVDAVYRRAFAAAGVWLRNLHDAGTNVDEPALLAFLRPALAACATADEMVTVVRATQAACLRAGWLLNAETTQLFLTAETVAAASAVSTDTWRRLGAYREPYRGAVCALAAAEVGVDDMAALTCGDIDPDGRHVAVNGAQVAVPAAARVFLRAQAAWRSYAGAAGTDVFFADEDGAPLRARVLAQAVRDPLYELGVALISQKVVPTRIDGARWTKRWGISVVRAA